MFIDFYSFLLNMAEKVMIIEIEITKFPRYHNSLGILSV